VKNIDLNNLFLKKDTKFSKDEVFDIAVIGAGIVGSAIFKEFCQNHAKTVLIEKENDILEGASKGNSAILHTGFDAPPNSLELKCVKDGYKEYLKIKDKLNLPVLNTQALVVAWNNEQLEKLDSIMKKGFNNGVKELEIISNLKLLKKEQHLSKNAKGALVVKGESLIDPWTTALAYVKLGVANSGKLAFNNEVQNGHFNGEYWEIKTSQQTIKAKTVINAAGLYGDIVEKISSNIDFKIKPRKGEFIIFDKSAYNLINSIILPVPTKLTKGIVVTKTAFGNILVGPTAQEQLSKTDSNTKEETLKMLKEKAFDMIPKLKNHKIIANFAGIRPSSDENFYRVAINEQKNWITVGGIRSTGLTSSLGLAKHIFKLNNTKYEKHKNAIRTLQMVNISEFDKRAYLEGGYDKIICHCECVTNTEIKNALEDEVGAGTIGGLKRRTRVTMGRCQGFNCISAISQMCEDNKSK